MGATLTTFTSALRNKYLPRLRSQLNDAGIISNFVKQNRDDVRWEGAAAIVHLHSSRNYSGVKSTGESGPLGDAGSQGTAQLSIPIRDVKGRFGVTLELIKATENQPGAVVPALQLEMKRLLKDIERQRNRMLFGFGQGTLAVSATGVASATQDTKDPGGVVGTVNPNRFIKKGMKLAVTDGTTIRGVRTVNSITDGNTIVLSSSVTSTTGDFFQLGVIQSSTDYDSHNKEPMGLLGIIDASTYVSTIFGLNRTSAGNEYFKSGVNASTGALSEDLLYRLIDNQEEISGQISDSAFVHPSIVREYWKLTQSERRYSTDAALSNPDAGVNMKAEPVFGGVLTFKRDKDAPYGTILAASKEHLFVIYMDEGDWVNFGPDGAGGEQLLRPVADKTDYEGVFAMFYNCYSDQGNALWRADGITATVSDQIWSD